MKRSMHYGRWRAKTQACIRRTGDNGRVKPSRGKRGTKDGAARHQDRRHDPSAIGTSGESCLGKRRRCAKNGGLRTGKRKHGVPEDMRGQSGQEGAGRDEAVTRATKGTDTEVGVMARSTAREHDEQGESEKRVMGSSNDRSTSTHSEESIDIRGKPMEGNRGAERVGTPRCAARKRRNPACHRRDRESIRRLYEADKGRGIGWRQRLGEHRRVWRIGWSRRFETIRWRWWAGRRRWFVWTGWTCSKWKTKPSKPTRMPRARLVALAENLAFSPLCFWHISVDVRLGGGGCREDFRP